MRAAVPGGVRCIALLLVALAVAGCAGAPDADSTPPAVTTPAATPTAGTPAASPPTAGAPPATPPPTGAPDARPRPAPEPAWPAEPDRTFSARMRAREPYEAAFLVNATDRVMVTFHVRNASPTERDFGAVVQASGPNGTSAEDSGVLVPPGGAFILRLSPMGLEPGEGPAVVRVRASATVAAVVEGRILVDEEVPERGGSTVPQGPGKA